MRRIDSEWILTVTVLLFPERQWLSFRVEELTPPLARAMDIIAAASMTHDRGFHMNPKNLRSLLSCKHRSTFRSQRILVTKKCQLIFQCCPLYFPKDNTFNEI